MPALIKTLSCLAAAAILCGCVNEIEWHRDDNGPCLVMNAQMTTGDSLHCVYLSISRYEAVSSISDGTVKCFVNGRLETEGVRSDGNDDAYRRDDSFIPLMEGRRAGRMHQARFVFKASFKPGDLVRIEATANGGRYSAYSEVTVPEAPSCHVSDTSMTVDKSDDDPGGIPVCKVRVKGTDISEGNECYRLTAGVSGKGEAVSGDGSGNLIRVPYSYPERSVRIDKGNDPVLCDGAPVSEIDLLGAAQNIFLVFSDKLFNGGGFELGFNIDAVSILAPDTVQEACDYVEAESTLHVHVWGLTTVEYNYLKALSIYEYSEGDISFTEPVSFPDNVEGGVGIVSIATPGDCTVTFRRRFRNPGYY